MRRAEIVGFPMIALAACGGDGVSVLDHPCPEWAEAPSASSLWEEHRVSEEPVPLALVLPFEGERAVNQGNHGLTHTDDQAFAFDFEAPVGTPVLAAAAGIVVWAEESHAEHGSDPSFRDFANYVVLDHGGGLFSAYVHLEKDGVDVAAGDVVTAGDRLGVTGMSGQLSGPHLHFHVENAWSETLPARFVGAGGCALFPQTGDVVAADPDDAQHLAEGAESSSLTADAFVENDVAELEGLPARLYERGETLQVSGRATLEGATEVLMLFLPPDGGAALAVKRWPTDEDGAFEGTLDLSDVAAGAYGVAFVASDGGPVSVARSMRTVVVD